MARTGSNPAGWTGGRGFRGSRGFVGECQEREKKINALKSTQGNKMHGPHLPPPRFEVWRAACHQSPSPLRKLHRYMVQATYTHKPRSLPVVTAVCGAALILWHAPDESPLTKFQTFFKNHDVHGTASEDEYYFFQAASSSSMPPPRACPTAAPAATRNQKTSQPPYPFTLNATHSERERKSESKFTTYPTILLYNTPAHTVRTYDISSHPEHRHHRLGIFLNVL